MRRYNYSRLILSSMLFFSLSALATRPDPALTPGVICTPQDRDFTGYTYPSKVARCRRNVSIQEKDKVALEYGSLPQVEWSNFEFDHLIPLCAGGSNDIRNLWPQPIGEAREKDVLENKICEELQAGSIGQSEAIQKVNDWITEH